MRRLVSSLFLLCAAGSAAAADPLPPIPAAAIPPECADVATVPGDAQIPQPAIEARIALATCSAEVAFNAVKVAPDDASLAALAAAAKPALDLLAVAIQQNDPTWGPVAQKARAGLYVAMVVRARNSIPPITLQTVGPALADHDQAHAALEPKLKPWLDQTH